MRSAVCEYTGAAAITKKRTTANRAPPPVPPYLASDGACARVGGARGGAPSEYRVVLVLDSAAAGELESQSRPCVVAHEAYQAGTNNTAEFLGLVAGLHARADLAAKLKHPDLVLYTDSAVARRWAEAGVCRTTVPAADLCEKTLEHVVAAEHWLRANPGVPATYVRVWNTAAWGEIPADFGRK